MRFETKHYLAVVAILILAMPLWAGKNSSHTYSAHFEASRVTMIGTMELQPGNYTFEAKEAQNQLDVIMDGKVIATVPCQWIQLPKKAIGSAVQSDENRVTEIDFEGRTEAVKIG